MLCVPISCTIANYQDRRGGRETVIEEGWRGREKVWGGGRGGGREEWAIGDGG
jgi:hypothetical protein